MTKIAIIGTVGVPANYGGFETLVENIISLNQSNNFKYTVYCSSKSYNEKKTQYKNAYLEYINLEANGIQSILYDIISLIKATPKHDTILILGVSGCCFLPIYRMFSKKRLIINIDGLEHKRDKWGKYIKKFLKFSEKMAVKYGDEIISDNKGIQDYVFKEYHKNSTLIAYGGNHVITETSPEFENQILKQYGISPNSYAFSVCRIEPENNVHLTLEAYKQNKQKILFIGNWMKSNYGKDLYNHYSQFSNIKLIMPEYNLNILNILRKNCYIYIHGHSAGGTNPSLVEAMFFKKPIIAYDVVYNRETTENKAIYFKDSESLISTIQKTPNNVLESIASNMYEIAQKRYTWESIVNKYESLY